MLKQRGWAALLPIGLLAIAATGGVVMVAENVSETPKPLLTNLLKGSPQERQGKVTVEFLDASKTGTVAPTREAVK